jgi:hypothetical protein
MIWIRKGLVHILSLLLFVALLDGALATSADLSLTHPDKIENWLKQSQLYDHFVSNVITQAQKSTGSTDLSGSVSLSDSVVQQAAKSAFPPALLQQDVNSFLDSNYAWLQGKTSSPNFVINLTQAKQSFAQQVGQYVQVYTASLPVCTPSQLTTAQGIDPLAASCRPAALTPQAAGTAATQQLANSDNFLSNPVITASSINPNVNQSRQGASGATQNQPYYQKLSHDRVPQLYRLATKLPLLLGGLAIISAFGIIFIAPRKRKGLRRVGIILAETGVLLILIKFVADFVLHKLEGKVFNSSSIGQLQQSLTDFAQRVESSLVKTDLLFGIVFLVLALIIFGILYRTRQAETGTAATDATSVKNALKQPDGALSPLPAAKTTTPPKARETARPLDKQRPRPPRLIQ